MNTYQRLKFVLLGVLFALFWSSASTATKFGIQAVQPLVLFQFRFFGAGLLMLFYAIFIRKVSLPSRSEVKQLAIFGFLNVTLYLSLFVLALQQIAAGIGSLAVSLNPLLITVLSGIVLNKGIALRNIFVLFLGILGGGIAVFPLLMNSFATPAGLLLICGSMVSYSLGAIYYSQIKWRLDRTLINGVQVFLGGLFMLPLTLYTYEPAKNVFNSTFFWSLAWLIVGVSIIAVSLWLWLLTHDTIRASFFLFLCPISGFVYASVLLNEPFTLYTLTGLVFVLAALAIGQKKSSTPKD